MNTPFAEFAASHSRSAPARAIWLDLARGIALVLVVAGHSERGLVAAGIWSEPNARDLDRIVYSFHIPLFFLISGIVFAHSIKRRPFLVSWRARTWRLLQPYLLWSVVLLALLVLAAGSANTPIGLEDALTGIVLLPVQPVSIFWFLYTLILCTAVSGLALEYLRLTPGRLLLWSALVHLAYLLWLSEQQSGIGLQFVRFAEHQLYFASGCLVASRFLGDAAPRDTRATGGFVVVAAAAFTLTLAVMTIRDLDYHSVLGTLAAFSGSAAVLGGCYLAARLRHWPVPNPLMKISTESLAIFCMHVPFLAITRMALIHLAVENVFIHLLLGTLAGLAGPLAALGILDRAGLASLAGFGDHRWLKVSGGPNA